MAIVVGTMSPNPWSERDEEADVQLLGSIRAILAAFHVCPLRNDT